MKCKRLYDLQHWHKAGRAQKRAAKLAARPVGVVYAAEEAQRMQRRIAARVRRGTLQRQPCECGSVAATPLGLETNDGKLLIAWACATHRSDAAKRLAIEQKERSEQAAAVRPALTYAEARAWLAKLPDDRRNGFLDRAAQTSFGIRLSSEAPMFRQQLVRLVVAAIRKR